MERSAGVQGDACINSFSFSVKDVLEKMLGLSSAEMKDMTGNDGCTNGRIFVNIGFFGDMNGNAYFGFSESLAFKLFEMMTFCEVSEVNDMVCSAIGEIANITSGTATTDLSTKGIICDIKPPQISLDLPSFSDDSRFVTIDTGIGLLDVGVNFD